MTHLPSRGRASGSAPRHPAPGSRAASLSGAGGTASGQRRTRRGSLGALLVLAVGVALGAPAQAGNAKAPSYPEAVQVSRVAAKAVLDRAGAETCLRGKITRALLGLSASCEAAGERSPLCSLADKAVVVTPMSLSFMDETAQQILDLTTETPGPSAQRP